MSIRRELAHLNGDLLCAVDIETTGLDHELHDIYEIAIVPVDGEFRRAKCQWLDLLIRPIRIENIDWDGVYKCKNPKRIRKAIEEGFHPDAAIALLERWFQDRNLGTKKIAPIGSNYAFEARFLRQFLGSLNYESMFNDSQIRDTMVIARAFQDLHDFRCASWEHLFPKVGLSYLANVLKVERDYGKEHTAISDAAITVDVLRRIYEEFTKIMIPAK